MREQRAPGPIQVFVIGFDKLETTERILAELRRVRRRGVIRLIDLLVVQKDNQGNVTSSMQLTDLNERERMRLGTLASGLLGLQAEGLAGSVTSAELDALPVAAHDYGLSAEELSDLAAVIPPGSAAALLVIEHHWAVRLRAAIADAGGVLLLQAMLSPNTLAGMGTALDAALAAEEKIEAMEARKLAAAVDAAQALADELIIEEADIVTVAEVVAAALALEGTTAAQAAAQAAAALLDADLIEAAAINDATEIVLEALAVEEPEEAGAAVGQASTSKVIVF
jgi:uncharacterized membrane protein